MTALVLAVIKLIIAKIKPNSATKNSQKINLDTTPPTTKIK